MSTDALESPLARLEQTTTSGPITHLPIWAGITAADVEPGVTSLVETVRTEFEALEADLAPTWEGVMEPLERIDHRLEAVIGSVTHLTSVKYSDDMQEAYDTVRPAIVAISNTMSQSRAVYDAMAQLRSSSEGQNLSVARARILDESIRGMERSGVALAGEQQDRYKAIKDRLAELSNTFSTNLIKEERESRVKVTDESRLDGVPAAVIDIAKNQAA
ncbi:MAG: oligopeptidase A, partial [Acidimicrobiales bacterium]